MSDQSSRRRFLKNALTGVGGAAALSGASRQPPRTRPQRRLPRKTRSRSISDAAIFVPNGFGWEQMVGDAVGVPRYAEAANVLLDDRYFDTLSGQQAYKCFACRVRKA